MEPITKHVERFKLRRVGRGYLVAGVVSKLMDQAHSRSGVTPHTPFLPEKEFGRDMLCRSCKA